MNVLIADDHAIVRDGLALLLRDAFDIDSVLLAGDGREAILEASRETLDLILLDLSMPQGMDGLQAIAELRKLQPKAKIVVFSMYDEEQYQQKAYEAGADGYLVKKLKGEEIIQAIQQISKGKKWFLDQVMEAGQEKDSSLLWGLPISPREKEVFIMTALGHSLQDIADQLSISVRTVENHRRNISRKLGINKRSEWLETAKRHGLIDLYV